jgi:hypothetical protein
VSNRLLERDTKFRAARISEVQAEFHLTGDAIMRLRGAGSGKDFFVTRLSSTKRAFNMPSTCRSAGLRGEHG